MKKKIKNVPILLLLIACLSACCNTDTYELSISGVESRALIRQDNNFVEFDLQNPINKEDFFIEIQLTETEMIVNNSLSKQNESDITVLEAAVVPCEDQVLVYKNYLESIRVDLIDVDNGNTSTDITDQLIVAGTGQNLIDNILGAPPGVPADLVDLSQLTSIPDRISYSIEVTTDDGLVFTTTSGIIQFN